MELNHDEVLTPPTPSASVVLLRQEPNIGLQVLLMQRHTKSAVLGGAYVFPGGKLDAADADVAQDASALNAAPADLCARLGEPALSPTQAAALYVAAARELLEECAVALLAHQPHLTAAEIASAQHALIQQPALLPLLQAKHWQLNVHGLVPWSRWITPRVPAVMSKRFDTRFFMAELPPGQTAHHDDREATGHLWISPRTCLHRYAEGGFDLAPPQIMSLVHLARFNSVADALADARRRPPPLIEPHTWNDNGQRLLCYPGDPEHPVKTRALPGPLRITFRGGRFCPADGEEAFC